jgi:hypothetical protein
VEPEGIDREEFAMRCLTTRVVMTLALSTGLLAIGPAAASAAAGPERVTVTEHVHDIIGSCGPGDDLVGDFTVTETVTLFASGRGTLRLELVGTIARSGTGVVGRYSERQRDFAFVDGSERVVGLLGHLVVAGGSGITLAGQARISADGTLSPTPGLEDLVDLDFEAVVCETLGG